MIRNLSEIPEIDDHLKEERIMTIFCLDDESEARNESIFKFLMTMREVRTLQVIVCLAQFGHMIMKKEAVYNYITKHSIVIIICLTLEITMDLLFLEKH